MAFESDARSSKQISADSRVLIGLIATLCLWWPSGFFSFADFSGRVVGVSDGDTLDVLRNGTTTRIRLKGIMCPEDGQPFAKTARQFTSEQALGQSVTVQEFGTDKNGRTIGTLLLPDGRVLNHELLKAGLAWWYRKYSKDFSLGDFGR